MNADFDTGHQIPTVEGHVFAVLRNEIVRGDLPPASVLRLDKIAARLGVSTMPVRAAVLRLEAEGLVRQPPRRRASVMPVELEDLEEIQSIRSGLEGFVARVGAERCTWERIRRMKGVLEELVTFGSEERVDASAERLDAYLSLQWTLHDICYTASGRRRLLVLIRGYRRRAERYIRLAVEEAGAYTSPIEHQQRFVRACEKRNGLVAESVIREALGWTIEQLAPILDLATSAPDSDGERTA